VTPPAPVHGCGNGSVASILVSDASLFYKNKQVNLKNKPKISNLPKNKPNITCIGCQENSAK